MRIVFMGTPDFAVRSLERLYNDDCDVVGVYTQPDKPRNRGMKFSFSPVKSLALMHNTPVYQPVSLKNEESINIFRDIDCDLLVVVAYGRILPKEFLDIPKMGAINIHGSLLPKYRGAAPIQWAILNGENITGVTSQFVAEEVDSGDIILSKETLIGDDETSGDLFERLSVLGAELLSDTVRLIKNGTAPRVPQDISLVTYAPIITKEMTHIDWTKTAIEINNKVRALAPKPSAVTVFDDLIIKIFRVDTGATTSITDLKPGTVVSKGKSGIEISCADGTVFIKELQAPGGKRMNAADFLRGRQ